MLLHFAKMYFPFIRLSNILLCVRMKNKWACWKKWSSTVWSVFFSTSVGLRKHAAKIVFSLPFCQKDTLLQWTLKTNHLLKWDRYQKGNISHKCASSAPSALVPQGAVSERGWNELSIQSQHADNFPHICEKCNLSVTLMMSAGCCVQRGIGLKCLWGGQGKPFQMERRRGKRDTIATKGVRYGSLGLHTGSSLNQLLVSSWSNLINLRGRLWQTRGMCGGCKHWSDIMNWLRSSWPPPAMPTNHPLTLKTFNNLLWLWYHHVVSTSSYILRIFDLFQSTEKIFFYWRGNINY